MTTLERAEIRVKKLQARNVRLALRQKLTPAKRDELGEAYDIRNALYATANDTTIDAAKHHYALALIAEENNG